MHNNALSQISIFPLSMGETALSSTLSDRLYGAVELRLTSDVASGPSTIFKPLEGHKEIRSFNAAADLKIAASAISMHLPAEWRRSLFAKIDALHQPNDWEDDDAPANLGSFWTFLRTVLQQGPMKKMSLGIDNDGHILAGWKRGRDTLTLKFLPDDRIHWSIVQIVDGNMESAAGNVALARLPTVLKPYCPEEWFGNGNNISSP
jgi:hypothetical protein